MAIIGNFPLLVGQERRDNTENRIYSSGSTVLIRVARKWTFVNFLVPWDKNVMTKADEKINNYSPLASKLGRFTECQQGHSSTGMLCGGYAQSDRRVS